MNIKFSKNNDDGFGNELKERVSLLIKTNNLLVKRKNFLYFKLFFYSLLYTFLYLTLFFVHYETKWQLVLHYVCVGLSGVFLAFNVSHDATHGTFSKHKFINRLIFYLTFNLQGTNAYLWGVRHKASHHVFPNVDGCDADIDDNPLIRLSPTKKHHWYHKYQAFYAFFVYCIYTLHWVLIKDWVYFSKSRIANLKNIKHTWAQFFDVLFWKIIYFSMFVVVPVYQGYPLTWVLTAFFFLHVAISLLFIFTLIISHLTNFNDFPVPNENGELPYNYYEHQLITSLDYYPKNRFVGFLLGGFNAHAAHHLFPNLPHTIYGDITPIIQELVIKYKYRYNETTWLGAVISHFQYLNKMGNGEKIKTHFGLTEYRNRFNEMKVS